MGLPIVVMMMIVSTNSDVEVVTVKVVVCLGDEGEKCDWSVVLAMMMKVEVTIMNVKGVW